MQVNTVMTRDVDLVGPNMRLKDAAMRMRDDNCGALPVGENDRLIGMVTDRDIAVRGVAEVSGQRQGPRRHVGEGLLLLRRQ